MEPQHLTRVPAAWVLQFLHFRPSLDALTLRSDFMKPITSLFCGQAGFAQNFLNSKLAPWPSEGVAAVARDVTRVAVRPLSF